MANYKRKLNLCCLAWHKKNRSHFEIIAAMLEAVKDNGRVQYSLLKHTGSSAQLKKYLESLTEIGFIETDIKDDRVLYKASEKGLEFLRQYYVLLRIMLSTRTCGDIVLPERVKVHES